MPRDAAERMFGRLCGGWGWLSGGAECEDVIACQRILRVVWMWFLALSPVSVSGFDCRVGSVSVVVCECALLIDFVAPLVSLACLCVDGLFPVLLFHFHPVSFSAAVREGFREADHCVGAVGVD